MTNLTSSSATLLSKLLCNCEKNEIESLKRSNNKKALNSGTSKRVVPTRNAATSPNLDIRKLGSMTTLTPSLSLTNELCNKAIDRENNKLQKQTFAMVESKPLKILRTTRSLSPRPPIRQQQAVLVPDTNNVNMDFFRSPKTNSQTNKMQIIKLCRSEQSSPNVIDGTEIQFSYNELTNRSTGCLGNAFTDPWLKYTGTDDKSGIFTAKGDQKIHNACKNGENSKDPWVKRSDTERIYKVSRNELFRQSKSFSATKFDIEPIIADSSLLSANKSPSYINTETKSNFIIKAKNQLQSAPTSPRFLTATENMFSSSFLVNKKCSDIIIEKNPIRSSSFSPARIKDSHNPFRDYNVHLLNPPPPTISVATEIIKEQNRSKSNKRPSNFEFLHECNPKFLTARHSFSSVTDQKQEEEVQLNIRRLSDQMRRKEQVSIHSITTLSSDHNVMEGVEQKVLKSPYNLCKDVPINSADFSEYLEQFRCSEAKRTDFDKKKPSLWRENLLAEPLSNQAIAINKTQQSSDCPLETTC